jgi:aminoglycoside/choline kinase family phosphotransferase
MNPFSDNILKYLQGLYGMSLNLTALQEEASTRRYFQILLEHEKLVVCIDEKINFDFIQLSSFLLSQNIRVPAVLNSNESLGLIVMSWEGQKDFSTLSLVDYKNQLPSVLDLLIKLQKITPPDFVASRKFDKEKLMFEIDLTISKFHAFKEMFKIETHLTNEALAFFQETAGYLDKHPVNVFTHRDFHSRNLLFNEEGSLTLIDFQDARMGVPQYDLASIVYDSYYPLPRDFRQEMITYFQKKSIGGNIKFKETFYLQALQRSFKALGTYFRMVVDEKKDKFKPSILACLEQLEEIIQLGMFADSLYIFTRSLRNELAKHPSFQSKSN